MLVARCTPSRIVTISSRAVCANIGSTANRGRSSLWHGDMQNIIIQSRSRETSLRSLRTATVCTRRDDHPSAYRRSLFFYWILTPPCDVGFEKLFLRDAQLEADSDFHLRNNAVIPRADSIADCARLLIDAFGDLLLAFAGWLHLDWVILGRSPTLTFCDDLR